MTETTVDEIIYTHEYLWRSSADLIRRSEEENSDYYLLPPALLMAFLAYEAFVNFIGLVLVPDLWENEKQISKGRV